MSYHVPSCSRLLENGLIEMETATIAFDRFKPLAGDACEERIRAARDALGGRAVILGHHYQRADVYRHADLTGDSLKLSKLAAQTDAQYIVFCGVHFMAEVADILSRPEQVSILPDLGAGCSMADMANLSKVERAWRELASVLDPDRHVTPVTYINSAADLKAFCGEHGGIVCTSSNARGHAVGNPRFRDRHVHPAEYFVARPRFGSGRLGLLRRERAPGDQRYRKCG